MVEYHNPHESASRLEASEMSASAADRSIDLGTGLSSAEPPSVHPAVGKLKALVRQYTITSIVLAFVVGFFLARLF